MCWGGGPDRISGGVSVRARCRAGTTLGPPPLNRKDHPCASSCSDSWPFSASQARRPSPPRQTRSEEHTSELQSQSNLVCRLLLEKKKQHPARPDRQLTGRRSATTLPLSLRSASSHRAEYSH